MCSSKDHFQTKRYSYQITITANFSHLRTRTGAGSKHTVLKLSSRQSTKKSDALERILTRSINTLVRLSIISKTNWRRALLKSKRLTQAIRQNQQLRQSLMVFSQERLKLNSLVGRRKENKGQKMPSSSTRWIPSVWNWSKTVNWSTNEQSQLRKLLSWIDQNLQRMM